MPYKGRFLPKNYQKYRGDYNNIIYRSSWELRVMKYFDEHPHVIWWASEGSKEKNEYGEPISLDT